MQPLCLLEMVCAGLLAPQQQEQLLSACVCIRLDYNMSAAADKANICQNLTPFVFWFMLLLCCPAGA